MDPLSVMASVVGLLTAAGAVASILSTVKSSISDAPRLLDHVLREVKDVEIVLSAIHKFLIGISSAPIRRIALIQVDQLIATLTESVLTFSELEALVKPLEARSGNSLWERVKWAWKEDTVSDILQRLQRHKSSLSLMLNIVQCESDLEAEQSRELLQNLVEQLLESNLDISRRLRNIEGTYGSQSTLTGCFRNSSRDQSAEEDEGETETITANISGSDKLNSDKFKFDAIELQFAFESDLNTSRVYKRTQLYASDVSFTSSAVRTHAWSMFSGLSLAQVSIISAVALPLYSHEISNSQWYNFGSTIQAYQQRAIPVEKEQSLLNKTNQGEDENIGTGNRIPEIRLGSLLSTLSSATQRKAERVALYKIAIMGDWGVGKTALTIQLCYNDLFGNYIPTVEDSYTKRVAIDSETCILEILDTGGHEDYTVLWDQWISDSDGFVLVYSITSRASFARIKIFHDYIRTVKHTPVKSASASPIPISLLPPIPIMLVGNKMDLSTESEVSPQAGPSLAQELDCKFVEASAKNYINVEEAFYDVVRLIRKQRMLVLPSSLQPGPGLLHGKSASARMARGVSQAWRIARRSDRKST